jgi:hypothetical protein
MMSGNVVEKSVIDKAKVRSGAQALQWQESVQRKSEKSTSSGDSGV